MRAASFGAESRSGSRKRRDPRAALLLHRRVRVRQRRKRRAAGLRERELGFRDALRDQPRLRLGRRRPRRRELPAPRHDGRRKPSGRFRHEKQVSARRRLFEGLEQRVGRRWIHPVGRRDDGDLRPLAMTRELGKVDQRADAVDGDLVDGLQEPGVGVGLQQFEAHQIRMRAGHRVTTAGADTAAKTVRPRRLAKERLREPERERMLADAARAMDQQRMRERVALRQELRQRHCLPREQRKPRQRDRNVVVVGARHRHPRAVSAVRCASSVARTSASGRVLSTTRKRCGSACARSR